MSTLMSLLVKLGVDSGEFSKELGEAEKKGISSSKNIANSLSNIGGAVVLGGIAAVGAGVAALATTIGPASDLNETISKVGVVFGDSAASVLAFGDTAANSLGMSKNAALSAAGTYGNLFRSMGMTEDTSADMSTSLVTLAGDLASFNNLNPTEVLDKLRAGLSGETEPLKTLGVNLNADMIKAKALSMGLISLNVDSLKVADTQMKLTDAVANSAKAKAKFGEASTQYQTAFIKEQKLQEALSEALAGAPGEIDAAAKAQASYALIMEQTSLAQGDFGRTSTGLANQQRILAANFENIKTSIGTGLLPLLTTLSGLLVAAFNSPEFQSGLKYITDGVATLANTVMANVPAIIAGFQGAFAWLMANEGVIVAILAVLGVSVLAFAWSSIAAFGSLVLSMLPIIAVIALIGVLAYLLYEAWTNNWGGIQQIAASVIAWITQAVTDFLAALSAFWTAWGPTILATFQAIWDGIVAVWNGFMAVINPLVQAFQAAFAGDWYTFGEKLNEAWDAAWKNLTTILSLWWTATKTNISTGISAIIKFFTETDWGEVGMDIIRGIANGILAADQFLKDAAMSAAKAAYEAAKGFLGINSPSTLFAGIGSNMMAGMALGVEQSPTIPLDLDKKITLSGIASGVGNSGIEPPGGFNANITVTIAGNGDRDVVRDGVRDGAIQAARAMGLL